jgi:hypothetical protein
MNPKDGDCQAKAKDCEPWTFPAMSIEYGAERIAAVEPRIVAHGYQSIPSCLEVGGAAFRVLEGVKEPPYSLSSLLIYIIRSNLIKLSTASCCRVVKNSVRLGLL